MKKPRRNMKIAAFVLAGLIAAGVVAVASLRKPGPKVPPPPGRGAIRFDDGKRLIVAGMQLEDLPAPGELPELFENFASHREIECSGAVAALKAPFRLKLFRGETPGDERIELITELHGRPLAFDAHFSHSAQTVRFELRGTIDHNDLAKLRLKLPRGASFEGTIRLTLKGVLRNGRFVETPELEGSFASGSRLFLGPFRLLPTGRFELGTTPDGAPQLSLPEARLTLANLELGDLQFIFSDREAVHFSGNLRPLAPLQLSGVVPFTGQFAFGSGDWSIRAALAERASIATPQALLQLTGLGINVRGTAAGGAADYDGEAESLSLRPGGDARRIWSGTGVKFRGEIEFDRNSAGQLTVKNEKRSLEFVNFALFDAERHFQAENLRVEGRISPRRSDVDFRLDADLVRSEQHDEVFSIARLRASGVIDIASGSVVKLEKFTADSGPFRLHCRERDFSARSLNIEGNFDRNRKEPGDNLEFTALAADFAFFDNGGNRFLAPHGSWTLRAELRAADRRPGVWRHAFNADAATWRKSLPQSEFSARLTKPEAAFTISDANAALRKIELKAARAAGSIRWKNTMPLRSAFFSHSWNFNFSGLSLALDRRLDGFGGKFRVSDGDLNEPERRIALSGISFEIPFSPPEAADAPTGDFAVKSVEMPQKFIESISGSASGKGGKISYKGLTRSALFAGGGFFFAGSTEIAGGAWNSVTEFSMPSTMLNGELKLSELLKLPGDWRFFGRMSATGELRFGESAPRELLTMQLSGDASDGGAALAGLTGEVKLPDAPENRNTLAFRSFASGDLTGGVGRLELSGGKLAAADFAAWGGKWNFKEARQAPDGTRLLDFEALNITPGALIANPAWKDTIADATFSGAVTLVLDSGRKLRLHAADLASDRSGVMRFAPLEQYRQLSDRATDLELVEFAAAAWKQFDFKQLSLKLRSGKEGIILHAAAEGRSASPLPFVYENGRFRRAAPTEYGFDAEIEITGDYKIPLNR